MTLDSYNNSQILTLRVISIVSSSISIIFGLIGFYSYINMNRKAFRHRLIILLISFDFIKAVILLWYPLRVLQVPQAYLNVNFCDIVGFFTSYFIEGADLAVLTLAIHTALVIFRKGGAGAKGGLYPFRKYVYALHLLLPVSLAALAFIHKRRSVYLPFVTRCYLPIYPYWLRLALSWIPRYIIIITIITIYIAIYVHVKLQYRQVTKNFQSSQRYTTIKDQTLSGYLKRAWEYTLSTIASFPGFRCLIPLNVRDNNLLEMGNMADSNNPQAVVLQQFQNDAMIKFRQRRNMIEKQVSSMFIYPIAYVFLWIAPLTVNAIQFHNALTYETENNLFNISPGLFWISLITEWMQPFNGTVDTIVFIILEKPWRDRTERVFNKKNFEFVLHFFSFFAPFGSENDRNPVFEHAQVSHSNGADNRERVNSSSHNSNDNAASIDHNFDEDSNDNAISSPDNSWNYANLELGSMAPIHRANINTDLHDQRNTPKVGDSSTTMTTLVSSDFGSNCSSYIKKNPSIAEEKDDAPPYSNRLSAVSVFDNYEAGDDFDEKQDGEMDLMEFLR